MADTKITRLRNLMTPVVNYVALWKRLENMDKSPVNNENLQEKLTDIIADERKKMIELMPEIIEIVKIIPDNACGQEQNTSEKAALLADVSGSTLDFIKELPKLQQCQASLKYQLMLLSVAANKLGLYDAADFIKRD